MKMTATEASPDVKGSNDELEYVYHDFSRVPYEDFERNRENISTQIPRPSIRSQKLPAKLAAILSDPEFFDIIMWMPHGRSWRILRPKAFTSKVIPKYFEYSNYNSFIRLVNAWGFRRVTTGIDQGSYYHELFLRGMPHLHKKMRRLTTKDKKKFVNPENEPDFYEVSRRFPLPCDTMNEIDQQDKGIPQESMTRTVEQNEVMNILPEYDRILNQSRVQTQVVSSAGIAEKVAALKTVNDELHRLDQKLRNKLFLQRVRNEQLLLLRRQSQLNLNQNVHQLIPASHSIGNITSDAAFPINLLYQRL